MQLQAMAPLCFLFFFFFFLLFFFFFFCWGRLQWVKWVQFELQWILILSEHLRRKPSLGNIQPPPSPPPPPHSRHPPSTPTATASQKKISNAFHLLKGVTEQRGPNAVFVPDVAENHRDVSFKIKKVQRSSHRKAQRNQTGEKNR